MITIGKVYPMKPPHKGKARLPRKVLAIRRGRVKTATVTETQVSRHYEWWSHDYFIRNICNG